MIEIRLPAAKIRDALELVETEHARRALSLLSGSLVASQHGQRSEYHATTGEAGAIVAAFEDAKRRSPRPTEMLSMAERVRKAIRDADKLNHITN